jgi:hypothetical protein
VRQRPAADVRGAADVELVTASDVVSKYASAGKEAPDERGVDRYRHVLMVPGTRIR